MNVTNLKLHKNARNYLRLLSLGEQLAAGKLIVVQDNNVYEVFREYSGGERPELHVTAMLSDHFVFWRNCMRHVVFILYFV